MKYINIYNNYKHDRKKLWYYDKTNIIIIFQKYEEYYICIFIIYRAEKLFVVVGV